MIVNSVARYDPTPHINAINAFLNALGELLEVSERDSYSGDRQIVPRDGQEGTWQTRRFMVDRTAPAAARALIEAGVGAMWKPPGTWSSHPINPVVEWATVLTDYPKFDLDTLLACCNQAIGSLETRAYELPALGPSLRPRLPGFVRRHGGVFVATVAATIVGGIVVAWAAFRLGWVG
jgi:hypothetical protein